MIKKKSSFSSVGETGNGLIKDLFEHIKKKLDEALELDFDERKIVLIKLFSELIESINSKYIQKYSLETQYFYELLGSETNPEKNINIEKYETELGVNEHFQSLFVLLTVSYIFEKSFLTRNRVNMFLRGCNRLFWTDVETISKTFSSIYFSIRNYILSNSIEKSIFCDILGVIFRYYFYYSCSKLQKNVCAFINKIVKINETDDKNKKHFQINSKNLSELFLLENISVLNELDINNEIQFKYLRKMRNLKELLNGVSSKVKNKIKYYLYILTRPQGGTTSELRNESLATLDFLFPYGKYPRFFLNQITRCFYQIDWPLSFIKWLIAYPKKVFVDLFSFVPFFNKYVKVGENGRKEEGYMSEEEIDDFDMMYLY